MKIIQAPDRYEKKFEEIACFMAGGMGNTEWHTEFLETLKKYPTDNLVIYNPYNSNITSNFEQIAWEYNYLNSYKTNFIFSIYFDKYTDQPISMYELGRALALSVSKSINIKLSDMPNSTDYVIQSGFPCVISLHENAPKKQDILIQAGLVKQTAKIRTPKEHALEVLRIYTEMEKNKCEQQNQQN